MASSDMVEFAKGFFLPPAEQNNPELIRLADDLLETKDHDTRNFLFKLAIPILQTTDDKDTFAKFSIAYNHATFGLGFP